MAKFCFISILLLILILFICLSTLAEDGIQHKHPITLQCNIQHYISILIASNVSLSYFSSQVLEGITRHYNEDTGVIRKKRQASTTLSYYIDEWRKKAQDDSNSAVKFVYIANLSSPFDEVVVVEFNKLVRYPIYLLATLSKDYFPKKGTKRPAITPFIYEKMDERKRIKKVDEAGHLLAYSLGGGMEYWWNYAPQSALVNRGRSNWRRNENHMQTFLKGTKSGRVNWRVFIVYEEDNPRPIGYCLQYILIDDEGKHAQSSVMYFNNDPSATEDNVYFENSGCKMPA